MVPGNDDLSIGSRIRALKVFDHNIGKKAETRHVRYRGGAPATRSQRFALYREEHPMNSRKGAVAAGHPVTANAAAEILADGGNAFDAALAALFASCVAEPVLASLGGGGFLLTAQPQSPPLLYDFFTQTPRCKRPADEVDFFPIIADFGTVQQEFHIGLGSIATPGIIKGAFQINRELGHMPMREIIRPACEAARNGVTVNALQRYINELIAPILESTPAALALHATEAQPDRFAASGETVRHREMADSFEALASEGDALFYQGEMGRLLTDHCRQHGGYLTSDDLEHYRVEKREPLVLSYHDARLFTNPAPSVGGTLIAFTLALLEREALGNEQAGAIPHLLKIGRAQQLTQQLRRDARIDENVSDTISREILTTGYLESYRQTMARHSTCYRGTTQISVADAAGNIASMTLSNGEGCGFVLPGTGIMLNNMLGEEDINPHGFHLWPEDRRIASMMSPTLMTTGRGDFIATGSGGSNRIRSAILQVLVNLVDFRMGIGEAVEFPRLHLEGETLNLEHETNDAERVEFEKHFSEVHFWPEKNLFFGGAHTVMRSREGVLSGCGDSRRGGVSVAV